MKTTSILQIILCYGAALCTTSPEPSPQTTTVTKRIHIIPTMLAAPTKQSAGTTTKLCTKTIPHKKVINRNEYAVAATLPLHGEIAITGKQVQFGTNLYFDKLKREVSTHSLPLFTYFFLDNNTDAQRARTDLQELRKQSPALLNLFGTKMIVALEKQMHNGNWASFFPLEGLDELRSQTAGNSIYLRASYHEELQALINYAVNTLNYRKIALFYEASDFGDGILTQFKKVLNDYGLVPAALGAYPENTVNISQAITSIINGAPNAIICASGARPTYNFISQMINHGMHRCAFLGLSPLFAVQKTLQKSRGINIIVSSVVPDPFKSSIPIVKEYQA
ncbi:MAG: ABC transporter substrate-binding protein, partial [Candidatus Babeliales bacterium]